MVALVDFTLNNDWSREAAAQGTIVVRALYENRREVVRTMLGTSGAIQIWQDNGGWATPWPPSYCVLTSGTGRYFIYWAGTTSLAQGVGHIFGSVIVPGIIGVGRAHRAGYANVNIPWLEVAKQQQQEIRDALGQFPPGASIHLFGHSYGGSIAALLGEYLKFEGHANVEVMTIGCPKVWSRGRLLAYPDVYYRIESEGDLVTQSPAPGDEIGYILTPLGAYAANGIANWALAGWQYNGTQVLLTADGTGTPGGKMPIPPPRWVSDGFASAHFTENYMGRIIQSWKVQVG